MQNLYWREYEYWTLRVYGKDSPEHKALLPDTAVWKEWYCLYDYASHYLRHPAYSNFPLVGITQEQARGYARWRSDRVFENLLIKWGKIDYNFTQTAQDHFNIESYYNGTYSHTVPGQSPPEYYPEYDLPTLEERRLILHYADSVDKAYFAKKSSKHNEACGQEYSPWKCGIDPCHGYSDRADPTQDVYKACVNPKAQSLYHLRGNVAEWAAEPGIATGGGWVHDKARILGEDTFHVQKTNAWTGFRNVCRWKKWTGSR